MKRGSLVLREIFRGYRILLVFNWEEFQEDSKESMRSRGASLRKDNYIEYSTFSIHFELCYFV